MVSGRRQSIVISCVMFETTKVLDPIIHYDATRAHLIYYSHAPNEEKGKMYLEFRDRVKFLVERDLPKAEILLHENNVFDFQIMIKTVLEIIASERATYPDSDIYVNISAGTPEYTAAAAIASMMVSDVTPFSVTTSEYTVGDDKLKEAHYFAGEPVGLTKNIGEIIPIQRFEIIPPDKILVCALRTYSNMLSSGEGSASKMISVLCEKGLWTRDKSKDKKKSKEEINNSNKVFFQRNYKDKWIEKRWIKKDYLTKKYKITEEGKTILDTFYVND